MKKQLLFIVLLLFAALISQGGTWYVNTLGTDDPLHGTTTGTGAFKTIQYAISRAISGDVIKVAAGTFLASNIVVDKSLTIEGTGATRDDVVIAPAAEDGNADNTFNTSAQNGFIIQAHGVTLRKLTINGRGNPSLTPSKNNFRTGIVTLDASQPGGGTWNNLHIDNVFIKFTYRRGISVFPRNVSGTVVENSRVDYVAYNHGIYLAGQSQAVNNTITHCFQGIVLNPDATTPKELFKINGNTLSQIGNFPGCAGDNGSGNYSLQPRAIEFDNSDPDGRNVEIKDNSINDIGSAGLRGTVGIYVRLANSASIIENNTITLTSGASFATGGSQSAGMLLGWSYTNGFTVRNNHLNASGYGIGIMIFGSGSFDRPMILDGNVLVSTSSLRSDTADGTGIYIANQYLYASGNKSGSCVNILNHNSISGFVRGIDVVRCSNSIHPLTVSAHNNSFAGNTVGMAASTLTAPIDATSNYWGGNGPNDGILYPSGTGSAVSAKVSFIPWWCDASMTSACPVLASGMNIMNTTTGLQYTQAELAAAFSNAAGGQTLFIGAGTVNGTVYNFPGKSVSVVGTGVPGQSVISGSSPALTVESGDLAVTGIELTATTNDPTVLTTGGTLVLRNCIINETNGFDNSCLRVVAGSVDAGTAGSSGNNRFNVNLPGSALENTPAATLWAIGNDWGNPTGPTIASNNNGSGGTITGDGQDEVIYDFYRNGPVTTVSTIAVCTGTTTVDIPVTVSDFNNVGSLSLAFGFTPSQLSNPTIVDINPAFSSWGPFNVTTYPVLLTSGICKVSAFGSVPAEGVTLPDGSPLFSLRFTVLTNAMASVSFIEDIPGTACEYTGVAPGHPYRDQPASSYYLAGGVTFNQRQKISGSIVYYNPANIPLLSGITIGLYQDGSQVGTNYSVTGGSYEFTGLCPGIYELRASSAKPTDGSVNTTDAAQVNNWGPHPFTIEKVRFYAGDVTLDNWLNSTDAHDIQQHFVNGTPFNRPEWTFWNAGTTISANPVSAPDFPSVTLTEGSDLTVNLYGLCTGDFNRSFNPLGKKAASKTLNLVYGRSMPAGINQEFDLPVRIVHASSVGAVSLILNFPAELVTVNDVLMNSANGEFDWAVKGNELRIGWNSPVPAELAASGNLITLLMKTTDAFTNGSSFKLTLAPDPLNELADNHYDVIGNAVLSVDVVEASPNGIAAHDEAAGISMSCHPNPFANSTTIAYSLPVEGNVIIEVRNMLGETVKILLSEFQPTGDHSLKLDAAGLAPGVYTATISLNNKTNPVIRAIKLVVNR